MNVWVRGIHLPAVCSSAGPGTDTAPPGLGFPFCGLRGPGPVVRLKRGASALSMRKLVVLLCVRPLDAHLLSTYCAPGGLGAVAEPVTEQRVPQGVAHGGGEVVQPGCHRGTGFPPSGTGRGPHPQ